jgi:hypothetical protein
MCRNIRVLHHFQPPTTPEEIRAAALQYVRKVSGLPGPAAADAEVFGQAVDEITAATQRLLAALPERGKVRTREGGAGEGAGAMAAPRRHQSKGARVNTRPPGPTG